MKKNNRWMVWSIGLVLLLALMASACAPAAAPTPTPTKPPAAAAATPTLVVPTPTTKPVAPTPTPAPPTPTPKPATVRVGALPGSVAAAPIHIAIAKGYYKEQGLDVQVLTFQSATLMIAPLASGDLEIGGGTMAAGLLNAIDRGVALKIVAPMGSSIKGFDFAQVTIRKDLIDSGQVKEVKDLKGRKIALSALGGGSECIVTNCLKQGGLTVKDVELVVISNPDTLPAYANKAVDAAMLMEPAIVNAVAQGLAVRWPPGASSTIYGGEYYASNLIASEPFSKNTDVARRFILGYVKAQRDYNDAFVKGKNKDEIISILTKATGATDPTLFEKMGMPYQNPDAKIDVRSMKMDLDCYKEKGYYTGKLEVEAIIDTQFTDYAVQQLGPYK